MFTRAKFHFKNACANVALNEEFAKLYCKHGSYSNSDCGYLGSLGSVKTVGYTDKESA
jgi:hypothetical protein